MKPVSSADHAYLGCLNKRQTGIGPAPASNQALKDIDETVEAECVGLAHDLAEATHVHAL